VQKASAGLAFFWDVPFDFRRMRRAVRATGRSPLPRENTFNRRFGRLARLVYEIEAASCFLPKRSLPPGLATSRSPPLKSQKDLPPYPSNLL